MAPASLLDAEDMQEREERVYQVSSQAVRRELRVAVRELRDAGLHRAAAWAAEQLVGLREDDPLEPAVATALAAPEPAVNRDDSDLMLLARRYFDVKVRPILLGYHRLRGRVSTSMLWAGPASHCKAS